MLCYICNMRLLMFFCLGMMYGLSAKAQTSFSVDSTFVRAIYPADSPVFYPWITLTNNSGTELEMRCVKIQDAKPAAWQTWLEDLDSAYSYVPDTSTFYLPAVNGLAQYLIVSFHPANVVGRATVVLKLYPANDPADSVLLTFEGNAYLPADTFTSITETNTLQQQVVLYPQPTAGDLFIHIAHPEQLGDVAVYNAVGQRLPVDWLVEGHSIRAFASELPEGVYVVALRNAQGQVVVRRWLKGG